MRYIFIILICIVSSSCAKQTVPLRFKEPARIDLSELKRVGVLGFKVVDFENKTLLERNGKWAVTDIQDDSKEAIGNSVRSIVVDKLSSSKGFELEFSEKLEAIRSNSNLNDLLSSEGESVQDVDAYIQGILWVGVERLDGADVAKQPLTFSIAAEEGAPAYTIDTVAFWNYQSMSSSLILELRLIDSKTGRIITSSYQSRQYKHKIGGKPPDISEQIKKYMKQGEEFVTENNISDSFQNQNPEVFPTFEESINLMAESVASDFIQKTIPSYRIKNVIIASGGDENLVNLLKLGAYEFALDEISKIDNLTPGDIYNQALAFEGLGEYQTALTGYREAFKLDPENIVFSQGIGRLERLKRTYNSLGRNLK